MKKPNVALIILTIVAAAAPASRAAFNRGTGGTASANFLRLGAGARYLAMGESATATAEDVNALYWNPGNVALINHGCLSLMQNSYAGSNYQFGGFAAPVRKWGTFGLSVQRMSVGDVTQTDATGRSIGSFKPTDLAVGVGWAHRLNAEWHGGLNLKYIQSKVVDSASTLAADAGVGYKKEMLSLGATVRNMGGHLKYANEENSLPLTVQTGVGYRYSKSLLLSSDLAFPTDAPAFFGVGSEYKLGLGRDLDLGLRAGYNSRNHNISGMSGFTFGMGFNWAQMGIDYAWIPLGDFNQSHRFSFNFHMGASKPVMAAKPRSSLPYTVKAAPKITPTQVVQFTNIPLDSDKDGVIDASDDCPQTPAGIVVNERGCPTEVNKTVPKTDWILRQVRFETDSATLKPESMAALDQAVEILKANPTVRVEVQGHTDNRGRAVYNLNLSERRALAVKRYLLQEGIAPERLEAKGYGFTAPLADNASDEGRANNRRMQFKVLRQP